MSIRYLDLSGAVNFWTNIKNYILSKIPTKTSELTNDSGFLTQHQSLSNYVTLNSEQTITGKKLFTASSIQLDSVTFMYGSTMFIDTSASAPRGAFPAEDYRVGRIYIGDGTSYNSAWFIVDPIISTNKAVYRMVTTNPDNTDSTRFSITWDSTKEGVRRRRNISMGDLLPSGNNTYNIGESGNAWNNVYANSYYLGTTAFGDIVTHNASEFLTSHPSITLSTNTTSTASPAHGGTFTCIDSVTQDTNGHITKVNTKTVTLPSDNNTDTKVKQYEGTTNNERPILSRYNSTEASQTANFVVYDTGVTSNPAKHTITASGGFIGNASSATEFKDSKSVTLTGYVNGTASSKAGWSIATALKNCYFHTGGTVTNTYFKVASGTLTGGWNRYETLIRFVETTSNASCTLRVYITLDGSALFASGNVTVMNSVNFDTAPFNVVYKNDTDKTLFEIYYQLTPKNHQVNALVLYETERKLVNSCDVLTMYNDSTPVAALPSDYTLLTTEFELYCGNLVPAGNNKNLGSPDAKWSNVYATTFTGNLTGNVTGNVSGTAANVTGTVAIANGGTGATTRLSAVKALTNEAVASPTHFLTITTNWGKAGYTRVSEAKTALGITGDIVSHNASEFLTSHQSLSSCVKNVVTNNQTIKSTGITRGTAPSSAQTFGIAFSDNNNKYIGNIYGQYATDKSTYVGLYAYKGTTTSNGDNAYIRVGYDASGNVYTSAPTPATADNSTQIATTAFVKAQGYLTSHQSLANYVTTNTDQSISGIKSHSKHISILGDYVGNESSTNGRSCLYLKANRDTDGKSGLYVTKYRQNRAQGSMGNSDTVFLSHDILENETRTNSGFVESYSNWANDVPGGMSIYSTIATSNLGTSAKPWTNAYAVNFYENGTALSDKYLTVSAISGGASTEAGNITPVKGTIISGFAESEAVTYSTEFGGVLVAPSRLYYAICVYNTSNSTMSYYMGPSVGGTGTWKLMGGGVSNPGSSTKLLFGLWIKIV